MASRQLRIAFGGFHFTLGAVVFAQSVVTVLHAINAPAGPRVHVMLLGSIEALGALLFLLDRTVRVGGALMLATFAVALAVHGFAGELALLVYTAGTLFVMAHGSVWPRPRATAA